MTRFCCSLSSPQQKIKFPKEDSPLRTQSQEKAVPPRGQGSHHPMTTEPERPEDTRMCTHVHRPCIETDSVSTTRRHTEASLTHLMARRKGRWLPRSAQRESSLRVNQRGEKRQGFLPGSPTASKRKVPKHRHHAATEVQRPPLRPAQNPFPLRFMKRQGGKG